MAKEKTGIFTILSALTVPEDVVKLKDGQSVSPGDEVRLPTEYGEHLVSLRVAKAGSTKAETKPAKKQDTGKAKEIADAEAALATAKDALSNAETDEANATAQKSVDDAQAALDALKG